MLEICRQYHCLPQLCSIRKHKAEPYYLSFSESGFSFTINYPLKPFPHETVQELCRKLMAVVLQYNGRIYLGKFPYITASECREMYPAYDKFLQTKNTVDSNKLFASEASLRLFE